MIQPMCQRIQFEGSWGVALMSIAVPAGWYLSFMHVSYARLVWKFGRRRDA